MTVFGNKASMHRLFAEQICAEYRIPVEGRGRKVDEWKLRPEAFDNHWWDGLVGCAVAASIEGVEIGSGDGQVKRVRVRLSDLRNAKTVKPEEVRTEDPPSPAESADQSQAPARAPKKTQTAQAAPAAPATKPRRMRLSEMMQGRRSR
jgi:hypothetical protein